MRKPKKMDGPQSTHSGSLDGPGASDFPQLAEFLTCLVWDDGEVREPGSLLVVAQGGRWRGWLNDRALARSAWLSGDTLWGLLEALDHALEEDRLEWRADRAERGKEKRRGS